MAIKMMPDPPIAPPPPSKNYGLTQCDFLPSWMPKETGIDAYDNRYASMKINLSEASPMTKAEIEWDKKLEEPPDLGDITPNPIFELLDF